jgi:hypothetical protein
MPGLQLPGIPVLVQLSWDAGVNLGVYNSVFSLIDFSE